MLLLLVACLFCFQSISMGQGRDLYSDTWVANDALGRELPGYDEVGGLKGNRTVGIFYFLWHGAHGNALYDITKILQANPTNPQYGPALTQHWWGEPEAGYYKATDPWVIRRNASMLVDAGVDFLYFDVSNAITYNTQFTALATEYQQIRAEGGKTPQFVFLTRSSSPATLQNLYDTIYSNNLYSDLWFEWDGKPLILGYPDQDGNSLAQPARDFFTFRQSWAWDAGYKKWQWLDSSPQDFGWDSLPWIPEQIPAAVASHPANVNIGTSHSNGVQPPIDQYGLTATTGQGLHLAEQLAHALAVDPEVLMVTGWNEWIAARVVADGSEQFTFLGQPIQAGDSIFYEVYNQEYNRDIEPMKGGHTDNFYYQLVDSVRQYKGVAAPQQPTTPRTIAIDGNFAEWNSVGPEFRDTIGDTMHRDHDGMGSNYYTNTTGRNDFVTSKVTNDNDSVYFLAETEENITAHTDQNWMMLFIDSDLDSGTGWNGYDYVVNLDVVDSDTTTLKNTTDGVNWNTVGTLDYNVTGNQMEIAVPRSLIGQDGESVSFNFHWSDNMQVLNDIAEFFVNGDSAPNRRFDYHFEGSSVILTADFDEDGDIDGADFLSWQRGLGITSGATLAQGDANFDGAVNDLDLIVWQQQFGTAAALATAGTVPEPTASVLLLITLVAGPICFGRPQN